MKKYKKFLLSFFILVLALSLAFSIAACTKDDDTDAPPSDDNPPSTPQEPDYRDMSAGEAKNLIEAGPVLPQKFTLTTTMTQGNNATTIVYAHSVVNDVPVVKFTLGGDSSYNDTLEYYYSQSVGYVEYDGLSFTKRTEWEYRSTVSQVLKNTEFYYDVVDYLNEQFGFIPLSEPAYSGKAYTDGRKEATYEANGCTDEYFCDVKITFATNADGTMKSSAMTITPDEASIAPAFDVAPLEMAVQVDALGSFPNTTFDPDKLASDPDQVRLQFYGIRGNDIPTCFGLQYDDPSLIGEAGAEIDVPTLVALPDGLDVSYFDGWYYDKDLTLPVTGNKAVLGHDYSTTLYPKLKLGRPGMNYGDAKLSMSDGELEKLTTTDDIDDCLAYKEGYFFEGWYFDSAFTQKVEYAPNRFRKANEQFYAKFSPIVNVSLETNVDGYRLPALRAVAGQSINYVLPDLSGVKGKYFEGWYKDKALTIPADEVCPDSDTTYYAKYSDAVAVDLVMPDGFAYINVPKFVNLPANADLEDIQEALRYYSYLPEMDGKLFDGWKMPNGKFVDELTEFTLTEEITLTAFYAQPYSIHVKFVCDTTMETDSAHDTTSYVGNVQNNKRGYSVWGYINYRLPLLFDGANYTIDGMSLHEAAEKGYAYKWEIALSANGTRTEVTEDTPWPHGEVYLFGEIYKLPGFTFELGDGSCSVNLGNTSFEAVENAGGLVWYMMDNGLFPSFYNETELVPYYFSCYVSAPAGKAFRGWSLEPNGALIDFAEYTAPTSGASVTLYAVYEKQFSITFEVVGELKNNVEGAEPISIPCETLWRYLDFGVLQLPHYDIHLDRQTNQIEYDYEREAHLADLIKDKLNEVWNLVAGHSYTCYMTAVYSSYDEATGTGTPLSLDCDDQTTQTLLENLKDNMTIYVEFSTY